MNSHGQRLSEVCYFISCSLYLLVCFNRAPTLRRHICARSRYHWWTLCLNGECTVASAQPIVGDGPLILLDGKSHSIHLCGKVAATCLSIDSLIVKNRFLLLPNDMLVMIKDFRLSHINFVHDQELLSSNEETAAGDTSDMT